MAPLLREELVYFRGGVGLDSALTATTLRRTNRNMNEPSTIPKREFNQAAAGWDEDPNRVRLASEISAAMCRRVTFDAEMDLMDFGCGTGLVTLSLAPKVRFVLGVDSSQGMVDVLSAKIAAGVASGAVQTRLFDMEVGGKISERFHRIVSAMTLHHIPVLTDLFRLWFDWLLPGGMIAAADLDKEDGGFHSDNTGVFHFGFERDSVRQALEDAGFEAVAFSDATTVVRARASGASDTYPIFLVTARKPGKPLALVRK